MKTRERPAVPRYRPFVDRGMSLPAPYAFVAPGLTVTTRAGKPTLLEANLGAGLGLTPSFWIDGSVGTLRLAPELAFHSAQIGPNLLLVDTPPFELDATAHVTFVADDGRPVEQIEPGAYAVLHLAHALRVDAGLYLDVNPGPTTTAGLRFPVGFSFQIAEHVHAVLSTGVTVASFADAPRTTAIPAGVTLGWSGYLGHGPDSVMVMPSIAFPEFIKPWAQESFLPGYAVYGITFVYVSKY
jgi:hypothetical protein